MYKRGFYFSFFIIIIIIRKHYVFLNYTYVSCETRTRVYPITAPYYVVKEVSKRARRTRHFIFCSIANRDRIISVYYVADNYCAVDATSPTIAHTLCNCLYIIIIIIVPIEILQVGGIRVSRRVFFEN